MEVAAFWARDTSHQMSTTALQAKFRLTPSLAQGCNLGAVIGESKPNDDSGHTPYRNGLLSGNSGASALHLKLGANRPAGRATLATWGLALEREFGAVTAHLEYFGQEQAKPSVQLGLRSELAKNVPIDGAAGHSSGDSRRSAGLKYQF